jgi:hypothetical protein
VSPWLARVLVATACSLAVAACNDGRTDEVPATLLDGTPARELSADLEGIDRPAVLTSVWASDVRAATASAAAAACLERADGDRPSGPIVTRVSVSGESVTFRNRSGDGLYGCDNSEGSRENGRRWCGVAFGRVDDGHLRDPRLGLGGCTTKDGRPLGFAWIEPISGAKYVGIDHDSYVEVYELAGGLPVRVTTGDVDVERSGASFRVSEHAADGRLLRRYRLEASVAG